MNHYQSKQIGNVHVCECDGRPKLNNIDGNKFREHMYVCSVRGHTFDLNAYTILLKFRYCYNKKGHKRYAMKVVNTQMP